jgi:hypothetical protein
MTEPSPFPFRIPTAEDSVHAITSPAAFNQVGVANKFQGKVLQVLETPTLGERIHNLIKYYFSDSEVKTSHIVEAIVRVDKIHSHIIPSDIDRHKPVVAGFADQSLVEGDIVEVVYEDPYTGAGGVVLRVVNKNSDSRTADKGNDKGGKPSGPPPKGLKFPGRRKRYFTEFPPGKPGVKNTVMPPYPLDSPFTVGFAGRKTSYIRQETLKAFLKIAEFAGWFYCAVDKAEIIVQSGAIGRRGPGRHGASAKGDRNPSFNHGEGFAIDYRIRIDQREIGKTEAWSFVAALISLDITDLGRLGAYVRNKKKNEQVGRHQGVAPHYDIRVKGIGAHLQLGDKNPMRSTRSVKKGIIASNPRGFPLDMVARAREISLILKDAVEGSKTIWKNCKSDKEKYKSATQSLNRGKKIPRRKKKGKKK